MCNADFIAWVRQKINTQAKPNGNSVSLGDYSKDGNREFYYPKYFYVEGDLYRWEISRMHTKGRHLTTHYEIWFYGAAFKPSMRIATGNVNVSKIRKGLRIIYDYYFSSKKDKNI